MSSVKIIAFLEIEQKLIIFEFEIFIMFLFLNYLIR